MRTCRIAAWVTTFVLVAAGAAARTSADARAASLQAVEEIIAAETQLMADAQADRLAATDAQAVAAARVARAALELARSSRAGAQPDLAAEEQDRLRAAVATGEDELRAAVDAFEEALRVAREAAARTEDVARRLAALRDRAEQLRQAPGEARPLLEGTWGVVIGPTGDTGWFKLEHDGTLVSGRYQLASGRSGSLTGAFVGGKLELEQVDAQYGRDRVFYGVHVAGSDSLKGSWETRIVGTGLPGFGNWSARRHVEAEAPAP